MVKKLLDVINGQSHIIFGDWTDLRVDSSVLLDVVKGVLHEAAHAAVGGRVAVDDVLKKISENNVDSEK